ncbi:MAG TPA: hypothetical protein VMV10_29050 [Pirellulales bacterium]|nr:hypothetical protein [Pirellulales bacterium]
MEGSASAENPRVEEFSLGLDSTAAYQQRVQADIARDRAATENTIAKILVGALVGALPVYFLALWARPELADQLASGLEKWFAVMGPLAGAAIGVGFSNSRNTDGIRSRQK